MKKDKNLPNKNVHSNNSLGKPLPNNSNYSRQQSPYNTNHRGRSPNQRNLRNFSQTDIVDQKVKIVNIEITIQDQTQISLNFRLMSALIQILEIKIIQIIDLETLHIIEIEIIPTIGIETIQMIEILDIKVTDQAIILTTDQTITDQNITTIKIDHAIIHRTEIQVITIDKETTLSHHIGITHVIKIHKKIIEVVHLNIKGKLIKYKQLKKLSQTPLVLIITKAQVCN